MEWYERFVGGGGRSPRKGGEFPPNIIESLLQRPLILGNPHMSPSLNS